jgi:hypothetical protein
VVGSGVVLSLSVLLMPVCEMASSSIKETERVHVPAEGEGADGMMAVAADMATKDVVMMSEVRETELGGEENQDRRLVIHNETVGDLD